MGTEGRVGEGRMISAAGEMGLMKVGEEKRESGEMGRLRRVLWEAHDGLTIQQL